MGHYDIFSLILKFVIIYLVIKLLKLL